jgi:MED6 mediator sub complex component
LYVIKMQFRKSPRETSPRDIFYCIDGIIYKSPDMLDLVRSRIAKASHYLGNSFDELHQTISYSSTTGHRCWSCTSANGRELNDGSKLSKSSSDLGQVEKKKASTTVNIREFPNFSRLIDDLESSF